MIDLAGELALAEEHLVRAAMEAAFSPNLAIYGEIAVVLAALRDVRHSIRTKEGRMPKKDDMENSYSPWGWYAPGD